MKTKYWLLVISALLVAGGLWFGRVAWRTRQGLVTLDVRNVSLADVLRQIERQTWKKIRAEKTLDAQITLRVTKQPLGEVLDRIAEQAGARWSTLYAIYDSAHALKALDSTLRGDGKLEPFGWTKLAPDVPALNQPGPEETSGPVFRHSANPEGSEPKAGNRRIMVNRTPDGQVVFMGSTNGRVEAWSPEELIMESALSARIDRKNGREATSVAAAETARKVGGKWTTYLAFRKSSMGIGFGGPPARPGLDPLKHGPNNPNDRFARLTPEQRVQRARESMGLSQK